MADHSLEYEYWLNNIPHISSHVKMLLEEHCGSAKAVYELSEAELRAFPFLKEHQADALVLSRKAWDPDEEYRALERTGAQMLTWRDPAYPYRISTISDAPYAFYLKGHLPQKNAPAAAIVGARACSPYGRRLARDISSALADAGVGIISGMALGIDGIAQQCALERGGYSLAVLGCGVDVCYPERHHRLYADLIRSGGVMSEFPVAEPPLKIHFPQRNRLISALADVVIVIEAREKSGSLITADFALEQGRDVYALPGPADSLLSRGCHRLIEQGAHILTDVTDLLKELTNTACRTDMTEDHSLPPLPDAERRIMDHLSDSPVKLSELELMTGLPPQTLTGSLMSLQLKGLARELTRQHYIRT